MTQPTTRSTPVDWEKVSSITKVSVMLALMLAMLIGLAVEVTSAPTQDSVVATVGMNIIQAGTLE